MWNYSPYEFTEILDLTMAFDPVTLVLLKVVSVLV